MLLFFGQFHPAFTHFPVALLLVAMGSEAAAWAARKPLLHQFGAWNLHLGAAGAVLAAALGWALASASDVENALQSTLFWHRWLGTAAAVWALLAVIAWHRHRKAEVAGKGTGGRSLAVYRVTLLAGGVLVAIAGHLGGILVYGLDYYVWTLK